MIVGSENSRPGLCPLLIFTDGVLTELCSGSTQPDRRILVGSHGLLRPRVPCRPGNLMSLGSIRALAITVISWCHLTTKPFGLEGPIHNCLSCGAIWRQNRRLEDMYHVLTGSRLIENES
ncbi:hypothetical protein M5K25_003765 [Dendrobium thyrsiflorum]|uniref:Uncharacterized protein n=1 Tax=Dendrobium thyrsiflorum TaxID=117978 RepID=A0ABD0VRW8_DENTH